MDSELIGTPVVVTGFPAIDDNMINIRVTLSFHYFDESVEFLLNEAGYLLGKSQKKDWNKYGF